MRLLHTKVTFFFLVLLLCMGSVSWAESVVKIGVLSFESKPDTASRWQPTANYLSASLPLQHFSFVPLSYDELNTAVKAGEVDFVLTNPEHYVVLRNVFRLSPMLTLNTLVDKKASRTFGGVIFTRQESTDILQLGDVTGRRVAAVALYSLGGFLAAADVFRQQHVDLRSSDVRSLTFTGTPHSKVVQEVMAGNADVGIVRTGVLEQMAEQGKLDLSKVRVLNEQPRSLYPQRLSTELYPEWPVAAMPKTPPELIKAVALALLNIQHDSSYAHAGNYYGFSPPANYAPVEELMRRLKVYPDVESQPLWKELWLTYSGEIEFLIFILFLAGAGASIYLWIGNRRLRNMSLLYQEAQAGLKVTAAAFESQVGIFVTDDHTRIVRANAAFTGMFGYAEPELLGNSTSMLRSKISDASG